MKQHTVPQNIMSVEFKIFGDLSIRQFVYISVAGGLAFIFYLTAIPALVKYPLITVALLLGVLVTFAKVNERPFDVWINNFITAVLLPTQRVWQKTMLIPFYLEGSQQTTVANRKKKTEDRYKQMISYLHSRNLPTDEMYKSNTRVDIEEIKMLTGIDKIFSDMHKNTLEQKLADVDTLLKSAASPAVAPQQVPVQVTAPNILSAAAPASSLPPVMPQVAPSPARFDPFKELPQKEAASVTADAGVQDSVQVKMQQQMQNEQSDNFFTLEPNKVIKMDDLKGLGASLSDSIDDKLQSLDEADGGHTDTLEPKNMDVLPEQDGMPQRELEPIPLRQPVDEMVREPLPEQHIVQPDIVAVPQVTEPELPKPESGVDALLQNLEEENRKLKEELEKTKEEKRKQEEAERKKREEEEAEARKTADQKLLGHMPDFVKNPNVVSGVVVDSNDKLMEDVVVIIKDKSKRIMRAMKTNILGQFYSRNPLGNGPYDVEANKEGYIFQPTSVLLSGIPLEPVIIKPKQFENKIDAGVPFGINSGSDEK